MQQINSPLGGHHTELNSKQSQFLSLIRRKFFAAALKKTGIGIKADRDTEPDQPTSI